MVVLRNITKITITEYKSSNQINILHFWKSKFGIRGSVENSKSTISEKYIRKSISGNHIRKPYQEMSHSYQETISENHIRKWFASFSDMEPYQKTHFFQIVHFFPISGKVLESEVFSNRVLFFHIRKSDRI